MNVTVAERFEAARALTTITNLFRLDAIWTACLDRQSGVVPQEYETLLAISNEMDSILSRIPEIAAWVHEIALRDGPSFESSFLALIENHPRPEVRGRLQEGLIKNGGALSLLRTAVEQALSVSENERIEIAQKVERAVAGGSTDGDLSPAAQCALAGVGLGLSAVAVAVAPGPSVLLAAALVLDIGAAADCL